MINSDAVRKRFFEGAKPIPEHLAREWTERLRAGEKGNKAHGIATSLLGDFVMRAALNEPQSPSTLSWLTIVFDGIMKDGKPDARRAFSLMPRKEGRGAKVGQAIKIAIWVRCATERGYSEPEAIKGAAAIFCCDERHIRRQRNSASSWAEGMNPNADWEEQFRHVGRPLPEPRAVAGAKSKRTITR